MYRNRKAVRIADGILEQVRERAPKLCGVCHQSRHVIIGLLPAQIRRQYRLAWDPVRAVTLRVGAEYAKRLLMPVLPRQVHWRPARMLAA